MSKLVIPQFYFTVTSTEGLTAAASSEPSKLELKT